MLTYFDHWGLIIAGCKENIPRVSCKNSFRLNLAHDTFLKKHELQELQALCYSQTSVPLFLPGYKELFKKVQEHRSAPLSSKVFLAFSFYCKSGIGGYFSNLKPRV